VIQNTSDALGVHLLAEYYECDKDILDNVFLIEEIMLEATRKAKAHIVAKNFHRFEPYGVSGVIIISESHLTIHTWPEYNFAAVDVFTCGVEIDPHICHDYLKEAFKSKNITIEKVLRGGLKIPELRNKIKETNKMGLLQTHNK